MKAESLSGVKKELQLLGAPELAELCLALAKYKKDNKEYLSFLLFRSHDKSAFLLEVKEEIDSYFSEIRTQANLYFVKKSLRKILRVIGRYSKYLNEKGLSAELYIYFCAQLKKSGIPFHKSQQMTNLYEQQLKKIDALVNSLHEDLQGDYASEIEELKNF